MSSKRILFTLLICLIIDANVLAQELKPHNVIIGSSYYRESELRPFTQHSYTLLETSYAKEPFIPKLTIMPIEVEESFAHNISVSGLTRSFGGFSELFLGAQGTLENSFLLFVNKEYDEAEKKLLSILPSNDEIGEKASLLLAWTKYHKKQFKGALLYAKSGFTSKNPTILQESYYISSLILLNQSRYSEIKELFEPYQQKINSPFWNSRLSVAYLYTLTKMNRWREAASFLWQYDMNRFAHSKAYYKLQEIDAIVNFRLARYEESLESLIGASQNNPDLTYQKNLNRVFAWIYYLTGQYLKAVELIDVKKSQGLCPISDEISYVKIASLSRLEEWKQVQAEFETLSPESSFYELSAFTIQTQSKNKRIDDNFKTRLIGIHYDFPEMKFHTSFLNGVNAYGKENFDLAGKFFLQAMSTDVENSDYNIALFNYGIIQLKQKKYAEALQQFQQLLKLMSGKQSPLLQYHILFCLYQLNEQEKFFNTLTQTDANALSKVQHHELKMMKANILVTKDQHQMAVKLYLSVWEDSRDISALEFAVVSLYRDKGYQQILSLLKQNDDVQSEIIFIYEVRAFLGSQNYPLALSKIQKANYSSEAFIELQLEVWLANRKFTTIIKEVTKHLRKSLSDETRLLYYLSLGDAHFNLEDFGNSKNQFFKALNLTDDPLRKSLIQYNIALITYYTKDYPSFLRETEIILSNSYLTPEIRYNLIQLKVDYYRNINQPEKVDDELRAYVENYSFQRAKAKLKRLQLLLFFRNYQKCHELAQNADPTENQFQAKDRHILIGHCGVKSNQTESAISALTKALKQKPKNYRIDEINLLLGEGYFQKGDYKSSLWLSSKLKSRNLNKEITNRNTMLLVDSTIHLKRHDDAKKELGGLSQYRETPYYSTALKLSAEISASNDDTDSSARSLLRVYYKTDTSVADKAKVLLRISEMYLHDSNESEAKRFFTKIDTKDISSSPSLNKRYQALSSKLKEKSPEI